MSTEYFKNGLAAFILDRVNELEAHPEIAEQDYYYGIMSDLLEENGYPRLDELDRALVQGYWTPPTNSPQSYWAAYALLTLPEESLIWEILPAEIETYPYYDNQLQTWEIFIQQDGEDHLVGVTPIIQQLWETAEADTICRLEDHYILVPYQGESQPTFIKPGTLFSERYYDTVLLVNEADISLSRQTPYRGYLCNTTSDDVLCYDFSDGTTHVTKSFDLPINIYEDHQQVSSGFLILQEATQNASYELCYYEAGNLLWNPLPNGTAPFSWLIEQTQNFVESEEQLTDFFMTPKYNPDLIKKDLDKLYLYWEDYFVGVIFEEHATYGWREMQKEYPGYLESMTVKQAQQHIAADALYHIHYWWHNNPHWFESNSQ